MSRLLVLLALCGVACAEAHSPPEDGGVPAHDAAADDAGEIDAPDGAGVCPDRDGDGHDDASCGGTDCADTDPAIGPETGPCADATGAMRCVGGALVRVECAATTPDCDARTGACVAAGSACGDGVVHPSERCDDANEHPRDGCDVGAGCLWGRCSDPRDCVPDAPFCSEPVPDGALPRCASGNPGESPDGERCGVDAECESGFCDLRAERCTQLCGSPSAECGSALRWCSSSIFDRWGTGVIDRPGVCETECTSEGDCAPLAACTVMQTGTEPHEVRAVCRMRRGETPVGSSCGAPRDCTSNNCLDGVCAAVCSVDGDCPPEAPRCLDYDFSTHWSRPVPRGEPWPTPWPRICAPNPTP